MVTQWFNVILGVAVGVVVASIFAVGSWAILAAVNVDDASTISLLVGFVLGLPVGGYVAARATLRAVFHGALAGVIMAGGVSVYASSAGGRASLPSLLVLMAGGLVLGGLGGWFAHRRSQQAS